MFENNKPIDYIAYISNPIIEDRQVYPDDEPVEEAKGSSFCAPMGSTRKSRKDAFFGHEYVEKLRSDHLQVKIGNCSVDTSLAKQICRYLPLRGQTTIY